MKSGRNFKTIALLTLVLVLAIPFWFSSPALPSYGQGYGAAVSGGGGGFDYSSGGHGPH